jgi:hypothetical protein
MRQKPALRSKQASQQKSSNVSASLSAGCKYKAATGVIVVISVCCAVLCCAVQGLAQVHWHWLLPATLARS